jgi:hypothetical protein
MLNADEIAQIATYHTWHLRRLIEDHEPYIKDLLAEQPASLDWQEEVRECEQIVSLCKAELARRGGL